MSIKPGIISLILNGELIARIKIFYKLQSIANTFPLSIVRANQTELFPITQEMYKNESWSGIFNSLSPSGSTLKWNFTNLDHPDINPSRDLNYYYLYPGQWNVSVMDVDLNTRVQYQVLVHERKRNLSIINSTFEYQDLNLLLTGELQLTYNGKYTVNGTKIFNGPALHSTFDLLSSQGIHRIITSSLISADNELSVVIDHENYNISITFLDLQPIMTSSDQFIIFTYVFN